MTTKPTIKELIDLHCEAAKAQVDDPNVKLEWWNGWGWKPNTKSESLLHDQQMFEQRNFRRLAHTPPPPRMVPLDVEDFRGANRVTDVLFGDGDSYNPQGLRKDGVKLNAVWYSFRTLQERSDQVSRDWGNSWTRAEKSEVVK